MDIDKLKRPENLAPGDKVKVWGDDLEVVSARPGTRVVSEPVVEVEFTDGSVVLYPPGVLVETA